VGKRTTSLEDKSPSISDSNKKLSGGKKGNGTFLVGKEILQEATPTTVENEAHRRCTLGEKESFFSKEIAQKESLGERKETYCRGGKKRTFTGNK